MVLSPFSSCAIQASEYVAKQRRHYFFLNSSVHERLCLPSRRSVLLWPSLISALGSSPNLPAPWAVCGNVLVAATWAAPSGMAFWWLAAQRSLLLAHVTSGSGKIIHVWLLSVKQMVEKYLRFFFQFPNQRIDNYHTHIHAPTQQTPFACFIPYSAICWFVNWRQGYY